MANALPIPPPGFEDLSPEEKLEYVQTLWDHIASDAEAVPLEKWQQELLDQRLEDLQKNPDAGVPWAELRAQLLRKVGNDT